MTIILFILKSKSSHLALPKLGQAKAVFQLLFFNLASYWQHVINFSMCISSTVTGYCSKKTRQKSHTNCFFNFRLYSFIKPALSFFILLPTSLRGQSGLYFAPQSIISITTGNKSIPFFVRR
jgi:hypothetical protein